MVPAVPCLPILDTLGGGGTCPFALEFFHLAVYEVGGRACPLQFHRPIINYYYYYYHHRHLVFWSSASIRRRERVSPGIFRPRVHPSSSLWSPISLPSSHPDKPQISS